MQSRFLATTTVRRGSAQFQICSKPSETVQRTVGHVWVPLGMPRLLGGGSQTCPQAPRRRKAGQFGQRLTCNDNDTTALRT
eukprot:8902043-Alexandrium_andersonii.AAC.1